MCYRTDIEDNPRIIGSYDEELKNRILYEANDTALSGHLGRDLQLSEPGLLVAQTIQVDEHLCPYV